MAKVLYREGMTYNEQARKIGVKPRWYTKMVGDKEGKRILDPGVNKTQKCHDWLIRRV